MLWQKLRDNKLGVKFRRQHPIERFLLDFYAPSLKTNKEYDQMRTEFLGLKQVQILRFWNSEKEKDLEGVLNKIKVEIKKFGVFNTNPSLSSILERVQGEVLYWRAAPSALTHFATNGKSAIKRARLTACASSRCALAESPVRFRARIRPCGFKNFFKSSVFL